MVTAIVPALVQLPTDPNLISYHPRVAEKVGFLSLLSSRRRARLGGMRDVLIVLFDRVQSLDAVGPLEVFSGAGFRIRTASLGGATVRTTSGLRIVPDADLREAAVSDLLLVPGGEGSREH